MSIDWTGPRLGHEQQWERKKWDGKGGWHKEGGRWAGKGIIWRYRRKRTEGRRMSRMKQGREDKEEKGNKKKGWKGEEKRKRRKKKGEKRDEEGAKEEEE